jgi:cytochrome P450
VWENGVLPSGTAIVIFAPFLHRDPERLHWADSFSPEIWLDGRGSGSRPFIPFSDGPAACPGRNLVLLLTSSLLAALLERHEIRQAAPGPLDRGRPLPATLSPFGLRFEVFAPGDRRTGGRDAAHLARLGDPMLTAAPR